MKVSKYSVFDTNAHLDQIKGCKTVDLTRRPAIATALSVLLSVSSLVAVPSLVVAQQDEALLEEIVVTGSRIRRDTFSSSSPLTVLDGEQMGNVGETNVGDFLVRTPSIVSSQNDVSTAGAVTGAPRSPGLNTISLRNLGKERTLVLVDGIRFVSGSAPGAGYGVDLNTISPAMIERIEVLTGNQSSVFGSDAMAGVINVITKDRFEGVDLRGQFGQTSEGDGEKTSVELSLGQNFGETGNAWVSLGWHDKEPVFARDRSLTRFSKTGTDTDGDGLQDSLRFEGSSFIPGSRLLGGGLSIKGDGTPFEGSPDIETTDRLNFYDFRTLMSPNTRKTAAAGLSMDLNERSSADLTVHYAQVESYTEIEPLPLNTVTETFLVPRGGTSGIDLATHPLWAGSSAGQQFLDAGLTSLDEIGNTFRRVVEFGNIATDNERTTFRIAGSVDYELTDTLRLDVSATYGRTEQSQQTFGDINLERAATALNIEPDGVGGFQCADTLARLRGCVPYNPFNTVDSVAGQAGITGFSDEAVGYLRTPTGLEASVEQTVVTGVLSGELPFSFTDSSNVGFAAGAEYRKEEGQEIPDPARQAGVTRLNTLEPTMGDFDVVEVFGELSIPLLPQLTVDLSGRVGDYSTVDTVSNWKVGFDAPLNDSVRLRGAIATAVRAPNISDLFAGRINAAGATGVDPCDGVDASSTGQAADNCRSIPAISNRIQDEGVFQLTQIETQGTRNFRAGNPDVQEEEADSFSAGVIFTPRRLQNFSLAVDWYQIEIDDAIRITSPVSLLDRCFEVSPGQFDPTCSGNVLRNPNSGAILELSAVTNNEEQLKTSGIDVEVRYAPDINMAGALNASLLLNYLNEFDVTGPEGDVTEFAGTVEFPDFTANLNLDYTWNDLSAFVQFRWIDSTVDRNDNPIMNSNLNSFSSRFYTDLQVSYRFDERANIYVGSNNLFDRDPPRMGFSHQSMNGAGVNGTTYQVIGREIYAGVEVSF